jgi:hypothetical protein
MDNQQGTKDNMGVSLELDWLIEENNKNILELSIEEPNKTNKSLIEKSLSDNSTFLIVLWIQLDIIKLKVLNWIENLLIKVLNLVGFIKLNQLY